MKTPRGLIHLPEDLHRAQCSEEGNLGAVQGAALSVGGSKEPSCLEAEVQVRKLEEGQRSEQEVRCPPLYWLRGWQTR